jgi:hypothetical protein
MRPRAAFGAVASPARRGVTDELPERDWLFPAILATLLAGSAISFVLAYAGGHIVQHQELRLSSDHTAPRGGGVEPMVLKVHGPSGE